MKTDDYEMPAEIDFTKMRVRKMGKGRKSFMGVPNPDYDPRFDPSITLVESAATDAHVHETGVIGMLALTTQTVTLAPDVAAAFKDADAVNEALRFVMRMARENPLAAQQNATT